MNRYLIPIIGAALLFSGTALAERLAVSASIANIRSGPGTDYEILWEVERYYPLTVLNKSDHWIFFQDFEGDKGWISEALVARMDTVIARKSHCNVRSGPGTDTDIRFIAERGTPFKVIEKKGNWIHIQHADGDQGWIHSSLVW